MTTGSRMNWLFRQLAKIFVFLFIIIALFALMGLAFLPDCTSACSAQQQALAYLRWSIQLAVAAIGIWLAVRSSYEPRLFEIAMIAALFSASSWQLGFFPAYAY
jgi:hypothetical protein